MLVLRAGHLAYQMVSALGATVWRRARKGPRRPGWSLILETIVEFLRLGLVRQLDLPVAEQRARTDLMGALGRRIDGVTIEPASVGGVPGAWFTPRGFDATTGTLLLYFHGGSYITGSLATHGELIARIAVASGAKAFAPLYRLAPEHPFPAALDDATAVLEALTKSHDLGRIVVAGDSAGGGLASALLVKRRDAGGAMPAALALIAPWVDLDAVGGSIETNVDDWGIREVFPAWMQMIVGSEDGWRERAHAPLVSPARAELRGLPPMRVDVGSAEMLRDQGVAFAERARAQGVDVELVEWPEVVHVFQACASFVPIAREAIEAFGAFVRARGKRTT